MFAVYVLESISGKLYVGHTSDLERRLAEHNSGMCKTTKVDTDWQVVYSENCTTRGQAMTREKWLKTGVGREFLINHIKSSAPLAGHEYRRGMFCDNPLQNPHKALDFRINKWHLAGLDRGVEQSGSSSGS